MLMIPAADPGWPSGESVGIFLLLTYGLSWLLWVPLLAWVRRSPAEGTTAGSIEGMPIGVGISWFLGASAPSLVAMALTARSDGWAAVRSLLRRLVDADVGVGWNAVAWLGPMVVGLAAIAVFFRSISERPRVSLRRFPLVVVSLAAAVPFGPLGEELGWRGYALPRLLEDRSAVVAALIVGVVWALWHLPLFWAPMGTTISGSPVTVRSAGTYVIEVAAASVIMTWLFVGTGGSLWIAVGFHAAWNAEMHRFLFAPFSDRAAEGVAEWTRALFVLIALILVFWPGLGWRAG